MTYRSRAPLSIWSLKMNPKIAIGIVPRPMYHPVRASSSERSSGRRRLAHHVRRIRSRSSRKYRSTAAIVPSWMTAVNAAPGSSQPRNAGTIRRWAVLETGRNSVSPCTMPSTMAWRALMRAATIAPRPHGPHELLIEHERGDGARRKVVGQRLRAHPEVEPLRAGAPVVVVDEHDGRAVGVAERDVPDVALDGRADPHRAWLDELRDVPEDVVVGLTRRPARGRVDRHDAHAGVAAAVGRPCLTIEC